MIDEQWWADRQREKNMLDKIQEMVSKFQGGEIHVSNIKINDDNYIWKTLIIQYGVKKSENEKEFFEEWWRREK